MRIEGRLEPHAPALAAGCIAATKVVDNRRQVDGLDIEPDLPATMRDTSRTSSTIWDSRCVAIQRIEAAHPLVGGQHAAAQQPGVADDRVQRRSQLVRQHGEELVFQPVGVLACTNSRAFSSATDAQPAIPSARR